MQTRRAASERIRSAFALASALAALAARPEMAAAQGTDATCARAFESGQELQLAGKLVAARKQLLSCAAPACPDFIRAPCVAVLDKTEADIPSLVVVVRDPQGRDVARARVKIDGAIAGERVDGAAIALDPGEHEVEVDTDGGAPVRQRVVVRRGERNRRFESPWRRLRPATREP